MSYLPSTSSLFMVKISKRVTTVNAPIINNTVKIVLKGLGFGGSSVMVRLLMRGAVSEAELPM